MGLIVLLLFTAILGLVMVGSVWGLNLAMHRIVGDKHRALEAIMETGQIPHSWRRPFDRRIAGLSGDARNAGRIEELGARARESYLKRLDGLVRYVQTSTLIKEDEARETLLGKLESARAGLEPGEDRP